ncbi:MAG: RNB domain-containing ribonuclease [Proteobacteria bacterium]|nr:RNB domain-containing ribonuclease [Pseudomonadota bacterium]
MFQTGNRPIQPLLQIAHKKSPLLARTCIKLASTSILCHTPSIMKSRRRQHSPHPHKHHKSHQNKPNHSHKPPQPRPEKLVARIEDSGPPTLAKVLNRDLASLTFRLNTQGHTNGQTLPLGTFIECTPANSPLTLNVEKILPATGAATWAAVCNFNLPTTFPPTVQKQAQSLKPYQWNKAEGRTDWRQLPIITIDGEDARDFDDAVHAEPLKNGGHKIIVAIADVAHYVQEGTELDKEALLRGNSTYFPNLVIPMLPEELSNNLCSLRPNEDRPVLGVEMEIDARGTLKKHHFHRATIHSHARLTYTQMQNALDGKSQLQPWLAGAQSA